MKFSFFQIQILALILTTSITNAIIIRVPNAADNRFTGGTPGASENSSFQYAAYDFSEGMARVKSGDVNKSKWGFINKTGELAIEYTFDDCFDFCEGLSNVRIGNEQTGKYGYIDKKGKIVLEAKYDKAYRFSDGLAIIRVGDFKKGKFGYIDKTGKIVLPAENDAAFNFVDGLACVPRAPPLTFIAPPITFMPAFPAFARPGKAVS